MTKAGEKAIGAVEATLDQLASMARDSDKPVYTREEFVDILERAKELLCEDDTSWAEGI